MEKKPCVVILGAGFGGLRAALQLSKKLRGRSCDIVLIDRNDYHTYTPTLYEAATTSKETANYLQIKEIVTFPVAEILKNTSVRFIKSEVRSLDLVNGDIHCANGERLKFDYLVLALGSETNYFGIPGLKENSLTLKTFLDALKIRDTILELMSSGKEQIEILIGGGGSTGVELAGELKGWLCELEEEKKCKAELKIIEASPTILPGFPDPIVKKAGNRLRKLGVTILANTAIERAEKNKVILKGGQEIPYDILIWTGGVKASSLMGALPLKIEKRGRVEVAGEMECLPQSPDLKLYGKIYGLGDAICFYDPKTGKPIPGVARAALIQADVVAHNIACDTRGRKDHKKYKPADYPYIIPVGGKWAVAKLGPLIIAGLGGWILKGLVELNYLLSIMPLGRALKAWLKGLRIFVQNDRLG
jgi:NADH dehydrogenase